MDAKKKRAVLLVIGLFVGCVIMFMPTLITGQGYSNADMDPFLTANMVVRSASAILGLLIIYEAVKTYLK